MLESRVAFEQAYSNWASSGADEGMLPARLMTEVQFTSPRGYQVPQNESPRRLSANERLYRSAATQESRRNALARKYIHEAEANRRDSSFIKSEERKRSHSAGSVQYALNRMTGGAKSSAIGPVHDRLFEWQHRRDARVNNLRNKITREKDALEAAELTFKPVLRPSLHDQALSRDPERVFDNLYRDKDLYAKRTKERIKQNSEAAIVEREGFFTPKVCDRSRKLAERSRSSLSNVIRQTFPDQDKDDRRVRSPPRDELLDSILASNIRAERMAASPSRRDMDSASAVSSISLQSFRHVDESGNRKSFKMFQDTPTYDQTMSFIKSESTFAKPSFITKQSRAIINSATPLSTAPSVARYTIFDKLYDDAGRSKDNIAALDAKHNPSQEHMPALFPADHIQLTHREKDVFERMYGQRYMRARAEEQQQHYAELREMGNVPSVRLSRQKQNDMVTRLYEKEMSRRVDLLTLEQDRTEEQLRLDRERVAGSRSHALVTRRRAEALGEIFATLLWSAKFVESQRKKGVEEEGPLVSQAGDTVRGRDRESRPRRYSIEGGCLSSISVLQESHRVYVPIKGAMQEVDDGKDEELQNDTSIFPLVQPSDLSDHLIDGQSVDEDVSPLNTPGRFEHVANQIRVRFRHVPVTDRVNAPPGHLDTSLADARLLHPPLLAEVFGEMLEQLRPIVLSQADFIEVVEMLLATGHFPPMNSLLCGKSEPRKNKDTMNYPRGSKRDIIEQSPSPIPEPLSVKQIPAPEIPIQSTGVDQVLTKAEATLLRLRAGNSKQVSATVLKLLAAHNHDDSL